MVPLEQTSRFGKNVFDFWGYFSVHIGLADLGALSDAMGLTSGSRRCSKHLEN